MLLSGEGFPPPLIMSFVSTGFAVISTVILTRHKNGDKALPYKNLLIFKIIVSVLLEFLKVLQLSLESSEFFGDLLLVFSLVLTTFCHVYRQNRGIVTSGSQHVSAILFLVCEFCQLDGNKPWFSMSQGAVQTFYLVLLFVYNILLCFADSREEGAKIRPEKDCSFVNQLTQHWFSRILQISCKRALQIDDLFELEEEMTSYHFQEKWENEWGRKMEAYLEQLKVSEKIKGPDCTAKPSLSKTVFSIFKWQFVEMFVMKLLSDVLQFSNPFMMSIIISVFSLENPSLSKGVSLAIIMFCISQSRSFVTNRYLHLLSRLGVSLHSLFSNAIYQKTLSLSADARKERSVGEIVNLLSTDVETVHIIIPQIQQFWSCPFQIVVCLIYLFYTLGFSALPGVVIMLISLPINLIKAKITKPWQEEKKKINDQRSKMINEVLGGIKVVKLYAWEKPMEEQIEDLWRKEVELTRKCALVDGFADAFSYSSPFLVALFSFGSFVLFSSENVLSPKAAFVSLTLFNYLWTPLFLLSFYVGQGTQLLVTIRRLEEFFLLGEVDLSVVAQLPREANKVVEWRDYTGSWNKSASKGTISSIDLSLKKGQFISVVGKVGSGKSSLLGSLLGELTKLDGFVGLRGTVAYVPQQPWIQNMTVRENILMNKPFDKTFYKQVLYACCLKQDLRLLPKGDLTVIGERGVNLSGGQKARIALARAVYQNCDLYLLDDPLSAVDAHVGRHIMQHTIGPDGILKDKNRILVAHGLSYVQKADLIAVMEDGKIVEQGSYAELEQLNGRFRGFLEYEGQGEMKNAAMEDPVHHLAEEEDSDEENEETMKTSESASLHEKELDSVGWVGWSVYRSFFRAATYSRSLGFLLTATAFFGLQTFRGFCLFSWADKSEIPVDSSSNYKMLYIYAATGVCEALCFVLSMLCLTSATVAACHNLHKPLLRSILRSPMQFFNTTPIGSILSRFITDMYMVDFALPFTFRLLVTSILQAVMAVAVIVISTPLFLLVVVPLAVIYWLLPSISVPTTRQLKRLEGSFRAPIISKLSETVDGVSSIRAFNQVGFFRGSFGSAVDQLIRCRYMSSLGERWLATRLAIIGNLVVLFAVLFAVFSQSFGWTESAGMVGLILSSAINITDSLLVAVRQICFTEANVSAIERIQEFSYLSSEADWETSSEIFSCWPESGTISFSNYSTRYRPSLDLVLKNITLNIVAGEKVGIVGRTGAGKSSLAMALFRMTEAAEGDIRIDGVDIKSLGLHQLRGSLTIIPQDPVLFPKSLRFNLDPSGSFSEEQLLKAIDMAHLNELVSSNPLGLDMNISRDDLSGGQRQLICLARAILRQSKILVLDEATAAVDVATDSLIQQTIRERFSESTVITIAHRINTVMDYDRIVLLDRGEICESGAPRQLLRDRNTLFSKLVAEAEKK